MPPAHASNEAKIVSTTDNDVHRTLLAIRNEMSRRHTHMTAIESQRISVCQLNE